MEMRFDLSRIAAKRGLSITEISRLTGVSRATITTMINKPESVKGIQLDTLSKIMSGLDVFPEDLFSLNGVNKEFQFGVGVWTGKDTFICSFKDSKTVLFFEGVMLKAGSDMRLSVRLLRIEREFKHYFRLTNVKNNESANKLNKQIGECLASLMYLPLRSYLEASAKSRFELFRSMTLKLIKSRPDQLSGNLKIEIFADVSFTNNHDRFSLVIKNHNGKVSIENGKIKAERLTIEDNI